MMIKPNLNVFLMPENGSDNRGPRVMENRPLPLLPFLLQLLSGKRRNLTMTQNIKRRKCQGFSQIMIVISHPEVSWERGLNCGRFEAFIMSQFLNFAFHNFIFRFVDICHRILDGRQISGIENDAS